jgi:threonine dehydratase
MGDVMVAAFNCVTTAYGVRISLLNNKVKTKVIIDAASINDRIQAVLDKPFYSPGGVVATPLIYSHFLSEHSGCNVYLKCM